MGGPKNRDAQNAATRYKVVFTPVGWQVIDTEEARDPVAEFASGPDEYQRAKATASSLNRRGRWHCTHCWSDYEGIADERGYVVCPRCDQPMLVNDYLLQWCECRSDSLWRADHKQDCPARPVLYQDESEIDVRDCPECANGTKGNYEGRVTIGGRGVFTCPVCGTRWQDADEKPSTKGLSINLRRES